MARQEFRRGRGVTWLEGVGVCRAGSCRFGATWTDEQQAQREKNTQKAQAVVLRL